MQTILCVALFFAALCAATGSTAAETRRPEVARDGLILYLDAAAQVQAGGLSAANRTWANLAGGGLGSPELRHFGADGASGWVGTGSPDDPYALRFDGRRSYAVGSGSLSRAELTLEAWARVEGHTLRAATLIGDDFGSGGISLMVQSTAGAPMLLHGATFSLVDAETPADEWLQVVVTVTGGQATLYVNGQLAATEPAPDVVQDGHYPGYQLGVARHPENDTVEADGLIGCLAIVRAYDRALKPAEVQANFEADRGRFRIAGSTQTPRAVARPGLCEKWDYQEHPIRASSPQATGWPNGARWAFDGYPTNMRQPYTRNFWSEPAPTPGKPASVTLNYRRPVAVTRFVHYFERGITACGWRDVEAQVGDGAARWRTIQEWTNLPAGCPQVLAIDRPEAAQSYRILVRSLQPGAGRIASHEIETYYGATIGSVRCAPAAPQAGKPCTLSIRVTSPDAPLDACSLRFAGGPGAASAAVPPVPAGGSADVRLTVTPQRRGPMPLVVELRAGARLVDRRPYTLVAEGTAPTPRKSAITGRPVTIHQQFGATGLRATWECRGDRTQYKMLLPARTVPVTGTLEFLVGGKALSLTGAGPGRIGARVPGGTLLVRFTEREAGSGDPALSCEIVPDDPNPATVSWLDLEMRLSVDSPRICFRPHIDWYTVEHGPNFPDIVNAHHSATRMLCVQTGKGRATATLSMVPDTDNLIWGFTKDNRMTARFRVPLAPHPAGEWRPIDQAPMRFKIALPVRRGDWWDAYRHVVADIFRFEQPRQWALPVTQMQMLSARYILRYEVWSEKWQTVRSHPWLDFFYNFYGTTYTLPALYAWYLATDDPTAKVKAEKVADWLLSVQQKEGPAAGAWFSQYCVEKSPPELVGRDQAWNRWVMPHSTGTSVKTLLWFWNATGRKDSRLLAAARRGCEWLLATQRPDGGWPYAFDLEGKPVTDLPDAGQIWCTWALWQMHAVTGHARYKEAALRSRDCFRRTFMDEHRYSGYWEDVSGAGGKVTRSWEGYEPAIAALVFADMGDRKLAIDAARDAATWSWTRVTSTRQYETAYGQTTEQSLCGPSQAQSPMTAAGMQRLFELTGDRLWSDFGGAIKAIHFAADPDQAYGMVATGGWDDPTTGVIGPPYENVRPMVSPNNGKGDEYGRQVWNEWETCQYAWLALDWLIREANLRAPNILRIDPDTLRGTVLGEPGRIKMPEERCDVTGIEHYDVNWVGCQNDRSYALVVMNHKQKLTVLVRPHEAHLGVYTKPPRVLVGAGNALRPVPVVKRGVQIAVEIPAGGTAALVWERIR